MSPCCDIGREVGVGKDYPKKPQIMSPLWDSPGMLQSSG